MSQDRQTEILEEVLVTLDELKTLLAQVAENTTPEGV